MRYIGTYSRKEVRRMDQDNITKGNGFIILGVVMAVVSVLIFYSIFIVDILPAGCFFLLFVTVPLVINGIAYLVHNIVARIRGKDSAIVLPLICLAIAVISAIIGVISHVNDHSFMMRGFEAELLWFFVSIPSLVVAIIHFIISFIHMSRRVEAIENRL